MDHFSKSSLAIGILSLLLIVFWTLKLRNIQRLKGEILQVETKLQRGQELWRNYPPLTPEGKRESVEAQERLIRMLPRDKDIPPFLQEVSRLAREYTLSNIAYSFGDGAASPGTAQSATPGAAPQVVPQASLPVPAKAPPSSGAIDSFLFKVSFAGGYREIALFLDALQRIPRVLSIQSVQLQRGLPLVTGEVLLRAYYQKKS